jgi:lipid-A-disaccharide synthase
MGFWELFKNISKILRYIDYCKKDISAYKPHLLILIDYPGFNLRIAKFAKENNHKTLYYISPQIWAWKASRVETIKNFIDKMVVILPFEKEFYKKFGVEVEFVGHPLLDAIAEFNQQAPNSYHSNKPILALLPGSRIQEIENILPQMLEAAIQKSEFEIIVSAAPSIPIEVYKKIIGDKNVKLWQNKTYSLLQISNCALVTSGTATLEAALFKVPLVVCYKGGRLSYLIAKSLVKLKYISLVNLIMDRPIVEELIQENCISTKILIALNKIIETENRNKMLGEYDALIKKLGNSGASAKAAKLAVEFAQKKILY